MIPRSLDELCQYEDKFPKFSLHLDALKRLVHFVDDKDQDIVDLRSSACDLFPRISFLESYDWSETEGIDLWRGHLACFPGYDTLLSDFYSGVGSLIADLSREKSHLEDSFLEAYKKLREDLKTRNSVLISESRSEVDNIAMRYHSMFNPEENGSLSSAARNGLISVPKGFLKYDKRILEYYSDLVLRGPLMDELSRTKLAIGSEDNANMHNYRPKLHSLRRSFSRIGYYEAVFELDSLLTTQSSYQVISSQFNPPPRSRTCSNLTDLTTKYDDVDPLTLHSIGDILQGRGCISDLTARFVYAHKKLKLIGSITDQLSTSYIRELRDWLKYEISNGYIGSCMKDGGLNRACVERCFNLLDSYC